MAVLRAVADGTGAAAGDVTPRREMALALGLVALGAAVVLLGAGRSRRRHSRASPAAPGTPSGTGRRTALALVALAGAGAALLVRNWARPPLGVVLLGGGRRAWSPSA